MADLPIAAVVRIAKKNGAESVVISDGNRDGNRRNSSLFVKWGQNSPRFPWGGLDLNLVRRALFLTKRSISKNVAEFDIAGSYINFSYSDVK